MSPAEPVLGIQGFLTLVRGRAGRDFDRAVLLQTLGSLSEAVSVALLVPILHLMNPEAGPVVLPFGIGQVTLSLPLVLIAFVALIIVRSLALERKEAFNARVTFGFATELQVQLFQAVAATRWSIINRWRTADLVHVLTSDADKLLFALNLLLSLVQSLAMVAILALLSLALSWQMTLAALVVGGILLAITRPIRRRAHDHGQQMVEARQAQYRIADEFLNGLRTAKAFGLEEQHLLAMSAILTRVKEGMIRFMGSRARSATLYQISTAIALAIFIHLALNYAQLALASIVALLFLYMRLAPRIMSLHSNAQELLAQLGSVQSLLGLLQSCEANAEVRASGDAPGLTLKNAIVLEELGFSHDGVAEPALSSVSATIKAGAITALVGPTGSGKSTLVDLILGLTAPGNGRILVDGVPLTPNLARAWQARIAYVPQESFLFNDSIAANLRMANPQASEAEMWEALRLADAAALVRALPAKLDHLVGERGQALSGGERQRIAIARALVRKPDLLILDEATSALDGLSQRRVAEAIRSLCGSMTVIAIAHRASMVAFADHVIVLDNGRLVESGPLASIMGRPSTLVRDLMDADSSSTYTSL